MAGKRTSSFKELDVFNLRSREETTVNYLKESSKRAPYDTDLDEWVKDYVADNPEALNASSSAKKIAQAKNSAYIIEKGSFQGLVSRLTDILEPKIKRWFAEAKIYFS